MATFFGVYCVLVAYFKDIRKKLIPRTLMAEEKDIFKKCQMELQGSKDVVKPLSGCRLSRCTGCE